MATTTFSGPVKSLRGFVTAGPDSIVNITAETTQMVQSHFQQSKQIAKVHQLETMTLMQTTN
jgi:hypothetical protein